MRTKAARESKQMVRLRTKVGESPDNCELVSIFVLHALAPPLATRCTIGHVQYELLLIEFSYVLHINECFGD